MRDLSERVRRERARYDEGLRRDRYVSLFRHCGVYHDRRLKRLRTATLAQRNRPTVLALGSRVWRSWLERADIRPKRLHCINVSKRELQRGRELSQSTALDPHFHLMDAHRLAFRDESFEVVIGGGILHHLHLPRALDEIQRVLIPGGLFVFLEPLDINPLGRIVRRLTPHARTPDERPFRLTDLHQFTERFDCRFYFSQFTAVPVGVVSRLVFREAENPMTWLAYQFDRLIDVLVPPARYLYRKVLIVGEVPRHTASAYRRSQQSS